MADETQHDIPAIQQWLRDNPNDKRASAVRDKLKSMGVTDEDRQPWGIPGPGVAGDVLSTANQALIGDPIEAVGQTVANLPVVGPLTQRAVRAVPPAQATVDWLNRYKERATQSPYQRAGRTALDIVNPLYWFLPELRAAGPMTRGAVAGAMGAALQPVDQSRDSADFWWQKDLQTVLGLGGGAAAGRLAGGQAARTAEQQRLSAQDWADVLRQGREQHQAAQDRATADLARSTDRWQADNATAQRQANERAGQQARDAQQAVPRQTSQEWWGRTLDPIGARDQVPNLDWQSGARVQDIIGNRLTDIRRQMNFPRQRINDLNETRQRAEQWIDSPNRPGFDQLYQQYIINPLIAPEGQRPVQMTGQALADYISGIGAQAQRMLREAARPNNPNASALYQQAWGLRQIQGAIENIASEGNNVLRAQLDAAKRAYTYWSIGDAAMQPEWGGVADPADLIRVWRGREGSASRYARPDQDPRNLIMKQWLEQQRGAHREPPPPQPVTVPTPRPPTAAPVPPTVVNAPPPRAPAAGRRPTLFERLATRAGAYWLAEEAGMPPAIKYGALLGADPQWIAQAIQFLSRRPVAGGAAAGQIPTDPSVQQLLNAVGIHLGPMQ